MLCFKRDFTIGNIALNERDGLGIWDTNAIKNHRIHPMPKY
jgi:hypothetical protein